MSRTLIGSSGVFEDGYGYSRAVRVGNMVAVAGTCARDHVIKEDAYEQALDAIRVIGEALEEAGASLADVIRTVTYVTDINDMYQVAQAHRETFGDIKPVATLVEVSALADPRYKVEIQVDAVVDAA